MTTCTTCTTCDQGLEHCHAPMLELDDGTYECTEGCGGDRVVHDELIGLADLREGASPLPAAA